MRGAVCLCLLIAASGCAAPTQPPVAADAPRRPTQVVYLPRSERAGREASPAESARPRTAAPAPPADDREAQILEAQRQIALATSPEQRALLEGVLAVVRAGQPASQASAAPPAAPAAAPAPPPPAPVPSPPNPLRGGEPLPPAPPAPLPPVPSVSGGGSFPAGDGAVQPASFAAPADAPMGAAPAGLSAGGSPAASSLGPPDPHAWRQSLERIARELERTLADPSLSLDRRERLQHEAAQRLCLLLAGRRDEAGAPLAHAEAAEREFWQAELEGLDLALDAAALPVADRRSTQAARRLREAADRLAQTGELDLKRLAFCSRVDGYGRFEEFPRSRFRPNQELLLYVELENFASHKTSAGQYETHLAASYQIFDPAGRRVAEQTFSPEKDLCANLRRDFFIPYRLYVPRGLAAGDYRLVLTVEDLHGGKFGQEAIDFSVEP